MPPDNKPNASHIIEMVVTLALVLLVIALCIMILSPFLMAVLWAVIIAVALYPPYAWVTKKFGGRRILTAVIFTVLMLAVILVPMAYFINSGASNIPELQDYLQSGKLSLQHPSPRIQELPVIGKPLFNFLHSLSGNITAAMEKYYPQILGASKVVLGGVLSAAMTFVQLLLSVIIAGVLLATSGTADAAETFFKRIAGSRGREFMDLCVSTIRSVIKGILGVAVIQSLLAGIGMFLSGVPYAGILTILCLVLAILQVGPGLVIVGAVIYLFYTHSTVFAVLWMIYFIMVTFSDNVLKPFLLGKGAQVPMLVIFLGVIGGFMLYGLIGLFVGPIILSIGYRLVLAWMYGEKESVQGSGS